MDNNKKKYRINELLDKLPYDKRQMALKTLPGQLDISAPTFNNYRYIPIDDNRDIPHVIVAKLELFFGLAPGELLNYAVEMKPIGEIDTYRPGSIAAKFGLTK